MSDLFQKTSELLEEGSFSATGELLGHDFDRQIIGWHKAGRFDGSDELLAEALTCASFLGRDETVSYLLGTGIDPNGGNKTGLNALHWAANRGNASIVKLLLDKGADPEFVNMYGGTVLGQVLWSAINEPRNGQIEAIRVLVNGGSRVDAEMVEWWKDSDAPDDIKSAVIKILESGK